MQQRRIHEREDGAIGTDAKRQRQRRHCRESARAGAAETRNARHPATCRAIASVASVYSLPCNRESRTTHLFHLTGIEQALTPSHLHVHRVLVLDVAVFGMCLRRDYHDNLGNGMFGRLLSANG
jgi:hypothetical protein